MAAIGLLLAATIVSVQSKSLNAKTEMLALMDNRDLWDNPPINPSIEETKRLLLICASLKGEQGTVQDQITFLERWDHAIREQGTEAAQKTALSCTTDLDGTDPTPPIKRPMVNTPTPP